MTTKPVNVQGRPFTWSFSAISEFEICPAQYAAKRFYMTHKDVESEALIWGSRVHKALEQRLKHRTVLPLDMQMYDRFCVPIMMQEKEGADLFVEEQICVNPELKLTGWFAKDAWGRGVFDVMLRRGDQVFVYDWKTGKPKDNDLQLQIFCALASLRFPDAKEFVAKFIWLQNETVTGTTYTRAQIPKVWEKILTKVREMEQAWKHENFPARRCGLCRGWCINTDCPEWEPKR